MNFNPYKNYLKSIKRDFNKTWNNNKHLIKKEDQQKAFKIMREVWQLHASTDGLEPCDYLEAFKVAQHVVCDKKIYNWRIYSLSDDIFSDKDKE